MFLKLTHDCIESIEDLMVQAGSIRHNVIELFEMGRRHPMNAITVNKFLVDFQCAN